MCRKSFPSRFSTVPIHNGPLYELGLPFYGPMDMDPSGPFYKACRALFLSSTVAPFTTLVRHP